MTFSADLLERHRRRLLAVGHLDDVVAELRGDDVADLARLEREGRLVERRHHLAAAEVVQVAALRGAAVRGVLLGELGEVLARLGPLEDGVDLGAAPSASSRASAFSSTRIRMWLARTGSACLNLSGFFS